MDGSLEHTDLILRNPRALRSELWFGSRQCNARTTWASYYRDGLMTAHKCHGHSLPLAVSRPIAMGP
jgi:hypothetical protein